MNKIAFFFISFILFSFSSLAQKKDNLQQRKLQLALYAIDNLYVDPTDQTKLVEEAIQGMISHLDPHSNYMDPEQTKALNEPLQGNFDGIGIQFNMLNDTLYVIQVVPGGPSEEVGVMAGDRIITVNDTIIAGVEAKNSLIMKKLRGKKGSIVHIGVKRGSSKQLIPFSITRGKIPVFSIDAAYMAAKHIGYIKLNRFAASSPREFREAVLKLKKKGMHKLILDLKGNGGGYLGSAIQLADEFLTDHKMIVYTENRDHHRERAQATARGNFEEGQVVVLVDETSASASEILSGALQDWDRAVIIGRRTFGKGLVQKPIPLPDHSMIRLTVARYHTPTGRCIQKEYTKGHKTSYDKDLINRYNNGELMNADSIHFPDSLRFKTLVNKRIVYGGGGIMPDFFIPIDTTHYSDLHRSLLATGLINRMTISWVDSHRLEMEKTYKKFKKFQKEFVVPESLMQQLISEAKENQIKFVAEQYNISKSIIKIQMKALIARDLYSVNEYFQIINEENQSLQKALEIITDDDLYTKTLGSTEQE